MGKPKEYVEIVEAIQPLLKRENHLKSEIFLKKRELKEIQKQKVELCLILAGVEDNPLVKQIIDNLLKEQK